MTDKLTPNDTIATTFHKLKNQHHYIANVRHKMLKCKDKHGSSYVKIGVTGKGIKPCYRITYNDKDGEAIYGSYWDMHDPLDNEHADNSNWSLARMDFAEIDQLMHEKFPTKLTKKT